MKPLRTLLGRARDLRDPNVFHQMSLVAFLAWVGLGADGLSSSAYGPPEAFKAIGEHRYLAIALAAAVAGTVFIISWSYSRIIEEFPHGGGGYIVSTKYLGPYVGATSGAALLVDYVLTIATSLSAGADAVYDFLPHSWVGAKFITVLVMLGFLTIMNLRGVKESVSILTPIFIVFLVTHAVLIFGAIFTHLGALGHVATTARRDFGHDIHSIGMGALALLFLKAFSLGGGTFTGIEAVSNGVGIMREPRVRTAKRTMVLMAVSLAITAGGILLAYLLLDVTPDPDPNGKTMNYLLAQKFLGDSTVATVVVIATMVAEGCLLFVAAQAGFVDGPRVMANMALDQWLPHRMAGLSEQLTMNNGVYLMSGAAALVLIYTHGNVDTLVVMYSINVFITFTLSNIAMLRHTWSTRDADWRRGLGVHGVATMVCGTILVITLIEKFADGGWLTMVITLLLVGVCFLIRSHYRTVGAKVAALSADLELDAVAPIHPTEGQPTREIDPTKPTAVVLAGGYGGLGLHTLMQIPRVFPGQFDQVIFVAAGVIDAGSFKGKDEMDAIRAKIEGDLEKYVALARGHMGWAADWDAAIGTEAVVELDRLCREVALRFPRSVFFAGKLIFQRDSWYQRLLHNETAAAVERRLQFAGLPMIVMPIRMFH